MQFSCLQYVWLTEEFEIFTIVYYCWTQSVSSVGRTYDMNHCSSQDLRIWMVPQSYSYMNYRSFHSLHSCTKLTCGLDSPLFLSHPLSVYVLSVCFLCECTWGVYKIEDDGWGVPHVFSEWNDLMRFLRSLWILLFWTENRAVPQGSPL